MGILYFHFISGIPPFASSFSDEQVKFNVLERNINWAALPPDTPPSCRDVIDRLLAKPANLRLGQKGGTEVKRHEHFASVDFDSILSSPGPLIPTCKPIEFQPLREGVGLFFEAASDPDEFFSL